MLNYTNYRERNEYQNKLGWLVRRHFVSIEQLGEEFCQKMSLFIGRLSKTTRLRDLEGVFERYGRMSRCDLKYGMYMW